MQGLSPCGFRFFLNHIKQDHLLISMFSFKDIYTYHSQLLNNEISCEAAVKHYLAEIEKQEQLNAFTEVYKAEALQKAVELDQNRKVNNELLPLHGVVVAIKDVICYKGHIVTASSQILTGFTSLYNASAVQFLVDAGAIIIGTCNCDEFAMGSTNENSINGAVLNGIDNTLVPGGSSGGSAVAVQAGLCMVSLGTDTGGSVRQPAAFCGIVGLKPTYGRISRYGIIAYASSFDQVGIFGTNIADVGLVLNVISRPDKNDSTMLQSPPVNFIPSPENDKKYKFCYLGTTIQHEGLDDDIRHKTLNFFKILEEEGHSVTSLDFDFLPYIVPAYYVMTTAEASSNLSRYDGVRFGHRTEEKVEKIEDFYKATRSEAFGWEVKKRIMLGSFVLSTGYYDAFFSKAQKIRRLLLENITKILAEYDAILMPVTPSTAYPLGQKDADPMSMYIGDIYTVFANLTGLPSISLPLFLHENNMPFGLQVIANQQEEVPLLRISECFMKLKN